mmetsp:Transcript_100406/g.161863  ORF Transcript_100406/g.161863 Transcript_100406/m.161863 type:complete len:278 (-) Transcript_100406:1597-2430(-)
MCWGVLRIVSVVGCRRIALVPPSRVRRVRIRVSARRGCVRWVSMMWRRVSVGLGIRVTRRWRAIATRRRRSIAPAVVRRRRPMMMMPRRSSVMSRRPAPRWPSSWRRSASSPWWWAAAGHGRSATRRRAVGVAGRAARAGPGRRCSASASTWGSAAPHGSTSRSTFEANLQRLAVDVVSVDALDRCTCVGRLVVVDKAEVATHACLLVTDDITAGDVAKGVKQLTQIPIVKVGRESSDVDVAVGRSFIARPSPVTSPTTVAVAVAVTAAAAAGWAIG